MLSSVSLTIALCSARRSLSPLPTRGRLCNPPSPPEKINTPAFTSLKSPPYPHPSSPPPYPPATITRDENSMNSSFPSVCVSGEIRYPHRFLPKGSVLESRITHACDPSTERTDVDWLGHNPTVSLRHDRLLTPVGGSCCWR